MPRAALIVRRIAPGPVDQAAVRRPPDRALEGFSCCSRRNREGGIAVRMRFRIRPLLACPALGRSLDLVQRDISHLSELQDANYER